MIVRSRAVVLGASNVTLGLAPLVEALRRASLGPVDLLIAHGHGRSYGLTSRLFSRTLPGLTACGLWDEWERREPLDTRAIVTDIGNDILYGVAPREIAAWVEECLRRFVQRGARVVVTGLPMPSLARLGPRRFRYAKALFFPRSPLSFEQTRELAVELHERVARLAADAGAAFIEARDEWYGLDPIHVRRRARRDAWRTIVAPLAINDASDVCHANDASEFDASERSAREARVSWSEAWRLLRARPLERTRRGRVERSAQPALKLSDGARVSIY